MFSICPLRMSYPLFWTYICPSGNKLFFYQKKKKKGHIGVRFCPASSTIIFFSTWLYIRIIRLFHSNFLISSITAHACASSLFQCLITVIQIELIKHCVRSCAIWVLLLNQVEYNIGWSYCLPYSCGTLPCQEFASGWFS